MTEEARIQAAILRWCNRHRKLGIVAYRLKSTRDGAPDIVLCLQGRFVGVETKSSTGCVSKAQGEQGKRIEKALGTYMVVHSLHEFISRMENLPTIRKGRGRIIEWGQEGLN